MRGKLEILALVVGFVGLIGVATITGLPMWKVTAFIGSNIIVMETLWEGLWMNCIRQANIQMQCKVYDSLLILPPDLQAARGLMCISVLLAATALLVSFCGTRRTTCFMDDVRGKNVTMAVGGGLFLLSCFTTLIPVCWTAHTVIRKFYNVQVIDAQKRELGEALYIGWATSGLLLVAGVILICRGTIDRGHAPDEYYTQAAANSEDDVELERKPSSLYSKQQYV
ncbi:hypothetical protein AAFF_G00089450 [Aldrovandia affinis]|uniref:Claudin n=1 Tax=Aldrovandia affinis TaxID=143900 RepID=A0AAD7RW15_9TELE|nr:hypothetical protein AAFF_G00089450 [Aldrovandia affinis]